MHQILAPLCFPETNTCIMTLSIGPQSVHSRNLKVFQMSLAVLEGIAITNNTLYSFEVCGIPIIGKGHRYKLRLCFGCTFTRCQTMYSLSQIMLSTDVRLMVYRFLCTILKQGLEGRYTLHRTNIGSICSYTIINK